MAPKAWCRWNATMPHRLLQVARRKRLHRVNLNHLVHRPMHHLYCPHRHHPRLPGLPFRLILSITPSRQRLLTHRSHHSHHLHPQRHLRSSQAAPQRARETPPRVMSPP